MKWLGRALLLCFGSIAAFAAVEVGVRLAYDVLPASVQAMVRNVRLWGFGGRELGPSWIETCVGDSELGARNLPDLDHRRVQFGPAIYDISTSTLGFDGLGFRGDAGPGPWDAVVVGDSFAYCHHVDYADCWVAHVAAATGLRIANLAVPGTGSVSHSRYLETFGRELDPKIVIWQYWVNDPREDVEHVLGGRLPCPRADAVNEQSQLTLRDRLQAASVSVNLIYRSWQRYVQHIVRVPRDGVLFKTNSGLPLFAWRGEGTAPQSEVEQTGMSMTTGAIGLAARRTAAAGGRFLLVIAPSNLQVYADELPNDELRTLAAAENRVSDRVLEFARGHAIETLDLRPAFIAAATRGEHLYPGYDVHWTPQGNRLTADLVAQWINDHGEP